MEPMEAIRMAVKSMKGPSTTIPAPVKKPKYKQIGGKWTQVESIGGLPWKLI
jgi:hypothetical protein